MLYANRSVYQLIINNIGDEWRPQNHSYLSPVEALLSYANWFKRLASKGLPLQWLTVESTGEIRPTWQPECYGFL